MRQQKHQSDADYWRSQVDRAIDYYEKAGNRSVVLRFACLPAEMPFAVEIDGKLHYRGRILECVGKPTQPKTRDIQTDIEGK